VATGTAYHRVCAVGSPDGDRAVEMASDCCLAAERGIPPIMTGGDKWAASGSNGHESPDASESPSESDEVISDRSP